MNEILTESECERIKIITNTKPVRQLVSEIKLPATGKYSNLTSKQLYVKIKKEMKKTGKTSKDIIGFDVEELKDFDSWG